MVEVITTPYGQKQVDPHCTQRTFFRWKQTVVSPQGDVNYHTFQDISPMHSEMMTRYLLDLEIGKNTAKRSGRGARSFIHLVNTRHRLLSVIRLLEQQSGKKNMDFTEDDVLELFDNMRKGIIHSGKGKPFLSVGNYAKIFGAFWRWYIRTQRKHGKEIPDVCVDLHTSNEKKPIWHHFTLKDVENMSKHLEFEYEALIYFLFDSGIRAPKEMMNVRVKDLSPVPDSDNLMLDIRDDTSKTFGRKIKLMLCSAIIKKYIAWKKLEPDDFLFTKQPTVYNRAITRAGFKVLKIGKAKPTKQPPGRPTKIEYYEGITMYDFRHNSVCHYLPIYKSENQMMYRYGWKQSSMIHYYSEYLGMKDTISEEDMLIDTTKTQLEQELQREKRKVEFIQNQLESIQLEMNKRIVEMEAKLLQKFSVVNDM